jgi:hypothetical protein
MHRPGALFELQLSPLHLDLSGRVLFLGEISEQSASFVLRRDERQRAYDKEQG